MPSAHSVLLSAVFGPLGVISNYLTRVRRARLRNSCRNRAAPARGSGRSRAPARRSRSQARPCMDPLFALSVLSPPPPATTQLPWYRNAVHGTAGSLTLHLRREALSLGASPATGRACRDYRWGFHTWSLTLPRLPPASLPKPAGAVRRRACAARPRAARGGAQRAGQHHHPAVPGINWVPYQEWIGCRTRGERGAISGRAGPD